MLLCGLCKLSQDLFRNLCGCPPFVCLPEDVGLTLSLRALANVWTEKQSGRLLRTGPGGVESEKLGLRLMPMLTSFCVTTQKDMYTTKRTTYYIVKFYHIYCNGDAISIK